jgi:RNA polymerase sigma factor (sigma-70 family)
MWGVMSELEDRRRRFELLYGENHGAVLGYLLRRTESPEDAADVIADVFLTAWRRLDDVPPGEQTRLWLFGVARRALANHHRGQRRRSTLGDRLRADLALTHPTHEHTGELAHVAAAFRSLSDTDRELIALAGWEGLEPREIAVVLGCSRNAARIRLHRARRAFAGQLELTETPGLPARPEVVKGELT